MPQLIACLNKENVLFLTSVSEGDLMNVIVLELTARNAC